MNKSATAILVPYLLVVAVAASGCTKPTHEVENTKHKDEPKATPSKEDGKKVEPAKATEKPPTKDYAKWSFIVDAKGKRQIPFEGLAFEAGKEPIELRCGLEYRLILTPKQDFIWLVAAFQTQRPGEFPDV